MLMPVFSPSALVTSPTDKYNTQHNKIYFSRHGEKFYGKTRSQLYLSNTKYYETHYNSGFSTCHDLVILVFLIFMLKIKIRFSGCAGG